MVGARRHSERRILSWHAPRPRCLSWAPRRPTQAARLHRKAGRAVGFHQAAGAPRDVHLQSLSVRQTHPPRSSPGWGAITVLTTWPSWRSTPTISSRIQRTTPRRWPERRARSAHVPLPPRRGPAGRPGRTAPPARRFLPLRPGTPAGHTAVSSTTTALATTSPPPPPSLPPPPPPPRDEGPRSPRRHRRGALLGACPLGAAPEHRLQHQVEARQRGRRITAERRNAPEAYEGRGRPPAGAALGRTGSEGARARTLCGGRAAAGRFCHGT